MINACFHRYQQFRKFNHPHPSVAVKVAGSIVDIKLDNSKYRWCCNKIYSCPINIRISQQRRLLKSFRPNSAQWVVCWLRAGILPLNLIETKQRKRCSSEECHRSFFLKMEIRICQDLAKTYNTLKRCLITALKGCTQCKGQLQTSSRTIMYDQSQTVIKTFWTVTWMRMKTHFYSHDTSVDAITYQQYQFRIKFHYEQHWIVQHEQSSNF